MGKIKMKSQCSLLENKICIWLSGVRKDALPESDLSSVSGGILEFASRILSSFEKPFDPAKKTRPSDVLLNPIRLIPYRFMTGS